MSSKDVAMGKLFTFESARSSGIDDYEPGPTPFVTSTMLNNGVVGYVTAKVGDKIFDGPALSISGLGDATVQLERFLPKGNGGDSLTICKPISALDIDELIGIAAAFNALHAWRFSFGRKASVRRIEELTIPAQRPSTKDMWVTESDAIARMNLELRKL